MNLVGIDPGISGAISILRDGNISMVVDMPTMAEGTKSKKQINAAELANILTKENISHEDKVILESVSAMPAKGLLACLVSDNHLVL